MAVGAVVILAAIAVIGIVSLLLMRRWRKRSVRLEYFDGTLTDLHPHEVDSGSGPFYSG